MGESTTVGKSQAKLKIIIVCYVFQRKRKGLDPLSVKKTGAVMRVLRRGQAYLYGLITLQYFPFFGNDTMRT